MTARRAGKDSTVVLSPSDLHLLQCIASATGLAQYFGVSRRAIYQWMDDPNFPEALDMPLSMAKHWHVEAVQDWRAQRR